MSAIKAGPPGGNGRILQAMLSALASQRKGLPLTAGMEGEAHATSWVQQQLWMLDQFAPGDPINNLCVAYRLRGAFSSERMERSINEVVARHDALRSTFMLHGGRLQRCTRSGPGVNVDLERECLYDDASDHAPAKDEAERIAAWTEAQARRPFVAGELPLLRASLLRIRDLEHVLVLTTHHTAFDGWSFDILMRELCMFYAGHPPAPWSGPRYGDYAAWQRYRIRGEESAAARAFWATQLAHAPVATRLPPDRSPKPSIVRRSRRHAFVLDVELVERVEQLANQAGTTDFVVCLAAYMILLHRFTATRDLMVGFPMANRCLAETRTMIGSFANLLPVRLTMEADDTFGSVLSRLSDLVPGIYTHQEYAVAALADGDSLVDVGQTQCNFAYQNVPHSDWRLAGLEADAWDVGSGSIANDMTLFMWRNGDALSAHVDYDSDRFDAATIAAFCEYFCALLRSAAARPEDPVASLSLGRTRMIRTESGRGCDDDRATARPDMTVHTAFREQARSTPHAVALVAGGRTMDYAALDRGSDRVAGHLRALTRQGSHAIHRPGQVIALLLPPSLERIVVVLAILKLGAPYLVLDSTLPRRYVDGLLEESRAALVVVEDADAWGGAARCVALAGLFAPRDDEGIELPPHPAAAACVMYTSGSSGRAKRITISHRGIVNLARSPTYLDPVRGDVFMQLAPMSFDASLFEIWGALLNGGRLVVLPTDRPSLGEIAVAIREHQVGVLWLSSGLFDVMLDTHPEALRALRQLLIGGDVVSTSHVGRYLALPGSGRLFNCYGPTENTTFTTVHPIASERVDLSIPVPIGRPIEGARVRVLDPSGKEVPAGIVGEACVGGAGLMLDGDGADSRLIRDETGAPEDRLYRTGDAVRWRPDGSLDFVGRQDNQLKLRGFRVEPAQVEASLRETGLVATCAVAGCDTGGRGLMLVAAVVPQDRNADRRHLAAALHAALQVELPAHLLPQRIAVVEALPLTANGKVDKTGMSRLLADAGDALPASPPRSRDETFIHAAFASALGHERFGIHDDFFSAGGDSLGTLQLLAQLECEYGAALSLVDIFNLRTVASLATHVGGREDPPGAPPVSGLVQLKYGSDRTPLFFVPGGKGSHIEMTLYAGLMKHVGGDVPVYGITTKPERVGRVPLPERAAAYVARIRAMRKEGPYLIAGECIGGVVAFEMARQLLQQGEDVALLMMDSWCPSMLGGLYYYGKVRPVTEMRAAADVARAIKAEFLLVRAGAPSDQPQPLLSIIAKSVKLIANTAWRIVAPDGPRPGFGADADFDLFRETMKYRPGRYPGAAVFVTSERNLADGIVKPWRKLAAEGLQVVVVPGIHETYLREHVATTAKAVRRVLDAHLRPAQTLLAPPTTAHQPEE
jgi:amino acid adenylation domain-containing protein